MESTVCQRYAALAVKNLRCNMLPHIVLSVLILCLAPVLFGINDLDALAAAAPLELFVSLTGIVLITPVFYPEQEGGIRDTVLAKYTSYTCVCALRVVCAVALIFLAISLFVLLMRMGRCDVGVTAIAGTFSTAVFLGGLGLFAYGLSDQIAVAYMMPVLYYAFNLAGNQELLGPFYLFSMMEGQVGGKIVLFLSGLLLLLLALAVKCLIRRGR